MAGHVIEIEYSFFFFNEYSEMYKKCMIHAYHSVIRDWVYQSNPCKFKLRRLIRILRKRKKTPCLCVCLSLVYQNNFLLKFFLLKIC